MEFVLDSGIRHDYDELLRRLHDKQRQVQTCASVSDLQLLLEVLHRQENRAPLVRCWPYIERVFSGDAVDAEAICQELPDAIASDISSVRASVVKHETDLKRGIEAVWGRMYEAEGDDRWARRLEAVEADLVDKINDLERQKQALHFQLRLVTVASAQLQTLMNTGLYYT